LEISGCDTHLIHSSENNLHNRVVFYFIKSNIISAIPNGPAYSRNSHPDQIPNLNIMIGKPTSEQMAYAPTLRQPGSNRNNPPNHSSKMEAKEEVLNCFIKIHGVTLFTSFPIFLCEVVFS
jgi:hypothetical protein